MAQEHSKMPKFKTSRTTLVCFSMLPLAILHFHGQILSVLPRKHAPYSYLLHYYCHHHHHSNSRPHCRLHVVLISYTNFPISSHSHLYSVLIDCCQINLPKVPLRSCHATNPKCLSVFVTH